MAVWRWLCAAVLFGMAPVGIVQARADEPHVTRQLLVNVAQNALHRGELLDRFINHRGVVTNRFEPAIRFFDFLGEL